MTTRDVSATPGSWMRVTVSMAPLVIKKRSHPLTLLNRATDDPPIRNRINNRKVTSRKAKKTQKMTKTKIRVRRRKVKRSPLATRMNRPSLKTQRRPKTLTNHLCLRLADQPRLRQMCISHRRLREWRLKPVRRHPSLRMQWLQLLMLSHYAPWLLSSHTEQSCAADHERLVL